ncbi:MAG: hypothetical protein H0V09_09565 [Gemmatimonadetes bacterium]|nr:hypothetical protein [Gemmatimonadota bacterium]
MALLPYVHPAWQIAALVLALWALRQGLRMRTLRLRKLHDRRLPLVDPHALTGLAFAGALALGYVAGPTILGGVRGEPVFRSPHAFFATLAMLLVGAGAALGWGLWRGRARRTDRALHAYCMGLALFVSLIAATLGLGLLP